MTPLLLFAGILEALKLHVLASYGYLALGHPLPFVPSSLALLAAAAIAIFLKRARGLRMYAHVVVHFLAFLVFLYLIVRTFMGRAPAPGGVPGFGALAGAMAADPTEFIVLTGTAAVFWLRGIWIENRALDHEFCSERFDEGIALFLGSMVLAAILKVQNDFPGILLIPYLVFSVLTLGISARRERSRGGFPPKSRFLLIAEFAAVLLLGALGVLRLVPALFAPAGRAAAGLKQAGLILLEYLARFLAWLFRPREGARFATAEKLDGIVQNAPRSMGDETSIFSTIIMYLLLAGAGIVVLVLAGYLLAALLRFLGSKSEAPAGKQLRPKFRIWLRSLLSALGKFLDRLRAGRGRGLSETVAAYRYLLGRGRLAGMPRKPDETPREYSARLARRYPRSTAGAETIILALEREIYGNAAPGPDQLAALAKARRKLGRRSFLAERLASLGRSVFSRARG